MTMTAAEGPEEEPDLVLLLDALGDRARLAIVRRLLAGPQRVVDLTWHLGLAQSTVSAHLARLVSAGVAQSRPEARSSSYRLSDPDATRGVLDAAENLLDLAVRRTSPA